MNHYFLVDSSDHITSAVIISKKTYAELQEIIDDIREKDYDYYYEDIIAALQVLDDTTVIERYSFKHLMY